MKKKLLYYGLSSLNSAILEKCGLREGILFDTFHRACEAAVNSVLNISGINVVYEISAFENVLSVPTPVYSVFGRFLGNQYCIAEDCIGPACVMRSTSRFIKVGQVYVPERLRDYAERLNKNLDSYTTEELENILITVRYPHFFQYDSGNKTRLDVLNGTMPDEGGRGIYYMLRTNGFSSAKDFYCAVRGLPYIEETRPHKDNDNLEQASFVAVPEDLIKKETASSVVSITKLLKSSTDTLLSNDRVEEAVEYLTEYFNTCAVLVKDIGWAQGEVDGVSLKLLDSRIMRISYRNIIDLYSLL